MPPETQEVPKVQIDEGKAISFIKETYNQARSASLKDLERFARYYKLFRNEQTTKNYTGLADLFVPEPYRIVRKKSAKLSNSIRSIKVTGETANDIEGAKIASQLLNYLRRKLNWSFTEKLAIQESRTVGHSWMKVLWNIDKEEVDRPYKGFDLSLATAEQIFLAPGTTMLDVFNGDIMYLIHEYEADISTLNKNENYNPTALQILATRGGGQKSEDNSLSQARLLSQAVGKLRPTIGKKKFQILEYWGKYQENDQTDPVDMLIVIADGQVVLRADANPYLGLLDNPIPFVPIVANAVAKEFAPIGDIEPGEKLFNELNDTRNQRMDTVTLNIDPPKEILRGAQIDKKQLVARRGWVIESNIPNGIRFIPPDMQGVVAAMNEEKNIRGDIQQYTGVIDFAQGTDVSSGIEVDTARGAIIAKGEQDVLTEDEINSLKLSLSMLYRIVLAYSQAFLDRSFQMRVVEKGVESFVDVDRASIQGNLDLDIEMRTLQDKTTEQQIKLMMLNQAKTVPGANIGRFFVDALEALYENVNIAEYYTEPQPQGPPPPSINISLRGELSPVEVDEVYKMTGADPTAADPLFRQDLREQMRGNLPEYHDKAQKELSLAQSEKDLKSNE